MRAFSASSVVTLAFTALGALTACGGGIAPSSDGTDQGGNGTGAGVDISLGSGQGSKSGSGSGSTDKGTGSGTSAGTGGGPVPAANRDCNYPTVNNPPGCPPAYTRFPSPSTCSQIGLKCWYPGAGDGDGKGCWSTALLACNPDRDGDGGADGDPTTGSWVGAQ
jgi:hypothetical protein